MKVSLNVSGFETEATFPDQDIDQIHKPLVERFTRLFKQKDERTIIFLCAPPGSGKSTLAAFGNTYRSKKVGLSLFKCFLLMAFTIRMKS